MTATDATFWDRIAPKYASDPIRNMASYEESLARTAAHLSPDDRVLEIGCGTGTTALRLAPNVASYHATDISPGMIEIACARAAETPVPGLRFEARDTLAALGAMRGLDAVLAFNLLHLVRSLDETLAATRDSLRPGGLFISKTPSLAGLHFRLLIPLMRAIGKAPYVRMRSADWIRRRIEAAGFRVVEAGHHAGDKRLYLVAERV